MNSFLLPENTLYPFCATTLNETGDKLILSDSFKVQECCSNSCQKKGDYCKKLCSDLNCEFKCDELYRICQTGCAQILPLKKKSNEIITHETFNNKKNDDNNGDTNKKFFVMVLFISLIFLTLCLFIVEK